MACFDQQRQQRTQLGQVFATLLFENKPEV